MFNGRHQQGDWLGVAVNTSVWPTDLAGARQPATVSFLDTNGRHVARDIELTPVPDITGQFRRPVYLGDEFDSGRYVGIVEWPVASNSNNYSDQFTFTVVPGGNAKGTIVGMEFFEAPNANFVVCQSDSGCLEARRNPQ